MGRQSTQKSSSGVERTPPILWPFQIPQTYAFVVTAIILLLDKRHETALASEVRAKSATKHEAESFVGFERINE